MLHWKYWEVKLSVVRDWPLLVGSLALSTGMIIGTLFALNSFIPLLAFVFVGSILAMIGWSLPAVRAAWFLLGLGVLGMGLVVVSMRTHPVLHIIEEVQDARVLVVSAPQQLAVGQRAFVDLTRTGGRTVRVRATMNTSETLRYGTVLTVTGTLAPPEVTPTFNERGYLRAHRAAGTLDASQVQLIGERSGWLPMRVLYDVRAWLVRRIDHAIHSPQSTVVNGVLLGDQGSLSADLEEVFRRTGTTHILVVSGSNVVIIAWVVQRLLSRFGRRFSAFATFIVLASFVVVSGADASVIRATVFYAFILLAQLTGQRLHAPTLVAWVATLMALTNPWILLYDVSFQLSFSAVLGLLLFAPWLSRVLPGWLSQEYLAPTLAAQVGTLPVLMYQFGSASIVAPLANLLVLPIVPIVMLGGVLTLVVPWLQVFSWTTEGVTTVLIWIVRVLGRFRYASFELPAHHLVWTGLACTLVAVCTWLAVRSQRLCEGEV